MSFSWTAPQPLTKTTGLAVYFTELQDAVDSLRQAIGQPAYSWYTIQSKSTKIRAVHYIQLKNVIDTLITDYGYSSVVDILGRNWSLYYVLKYGYNTAPNQLLQDFRDILDALTVSLEQFVKTWNYYPFNFYIADIFKIETITGDLGDWTLKYAPQSTSMGFVSNCVDSFISDDQDSIVKITGIGVYGEYLATVNYSQLAQNTSFVQGFDFYLENLKEIKLTENNMFKIELTANYSEAFASINPPPDIYSSPQIVYPSLIIKVQFLNNNNIFYIYFILAHENSWEYFTQLYAGSRNKVYTVGYMDINQEFDIYTDLKGLLDFNENQITYLKYINISQSTTSAFISGFYDINEVITMSGSAPNYEIGINKIGISHT